MVKLGTHNILYNQSYDTFIRLSSTVIEYRFRFIKQAYTFSSHTFRKNNEKIPLSIGERATVKCTSNCYLCKTYGIKSTYSFPAIDRKQKKYVIIDMNPSMGLFMVQQIAQNMSHHPISYEVLFKTNPGYYMNSLCVSTIEPYEEKIIDSVGPDWYEEHYKNILSYDDVLNANSNVSEKIKLPNDTIGLSCINCMKVFPFVEPNIGDNYICYDCRQVWK